MTAQTEFVGVRITPAEKETLIQLAEERDMTISDLLRSWIRENRMQSDDGKAFRRYRATKGSLPFGKWFGRGDKNA